MYRNILLSIFLFITFCSTVPASADLIFKRKVIDKCDEAKADIGRLERDKQIASIEDLKLVLKLDLTAFESPNPELNLPNKIPGMNLPMDGVKNDEYWKTFQPDREIKAKYCALEIIKSLSPYSIEALPEMIELTLNHTLPHNLQNLLYELIQSVVLDAKNDPKFIVPPLIIDRLIFMLDKPYSYYAQNALIEMYGISLPKLFRKMEDPDGRFRQIITETLLRLDNKGELIGSGALNLLQSADDGLRKRGIILLSELDNYYSFSLPPLIELVFDISPDIQDTTIDALDHIFSNLKDVPKISLSDASISTIFKKIKVSQGRERRILSKGLNKLLILNETYEKKIIDLFKSEDAELKVDLLSIINPSQKISPQLKNLLFTTLKDKNNSVRLKAIQVINAAKLQNSTSNSALLKLLEDPSPEIRKQAEAEVISLDKVISPELLKFFKSKNISEKSKYVKLMIRLAPEDKEVSAVFENSIKKQNCDGKASVTILAPQLTKKFRNQLLKDLSACLLHKDSDYSLISESIIAMSPLSADEKSIVSKTISSPEAADKALLFVLINSSKLGFGNEEVIVLFKRLFAVDDKTIKFRTINYLNNLDPAGLALSEDLVKFQNENADDDLLANEAVVAISRVSGSSFDIKGFFLKEIESDRYQWAEKYIDRIQSELALSIIKQSLESLPVSKKSIAISMAGRFGKAAAELLPKIKEHLEAPDSSLSYASTIALVKIDPSDPLAETSLRKIFYRDLADALLKEEFDNSILPLLEKLKTTSVSFIERKMLAQLVASVKR